MTMYGFPVSSSYILPFSPKKFEKIEEKYEIIEKIYDNPLSATEIHLATDENKTPYAIKEIKKSKLRDRLLQELAKSELSIHYSLSKKSNNIVNVYDYYETESSFYMIMEYCPNPTYFRYQLENVIIT
jgi:serine/threonine protein kinase